MVYEPKRHFYSCWDYIAFIGLLGTGICRCILVLYLGRAPRTKETLPDFLKWRRVTRHPLLFRGLTGSQRTPEFWRVTAYKVVIDYERRRVNTYTQDGTRVVFQGDKHDILPQTGYESGCQGQLAGWLASLTLKDEERPDLDLPRVV